MASASMETPRRIHISGLAPTIKPAELATRFSSFGTVVGGEAGVGGLGVDGNGKPRTFAFLTLEASDAQFKRCTSMLSGSMWKGHKLRIALANPDYTIRMDKERREREGDTEVKKPKKKKRKTNVDPSVGTQARDFELITLENIKGHRGWTLDATPVPTPIFPVITRPSHPLPDLPPKAATTSWTRETARAKASKTARAAIRSGVPSTVEPLTRSRIVRIDPRRWGRKKILYPTADGSENSGWISEVRGEWECLEAEEGMPLSEEVLWVFRARDGSVKRKELVRLTQRDRPHTDNFSALLEGLVRPATADPLSAAPKPMLPTESSLMLDTLPTAKVPATRPRSLSPPPYVSSAPRTLLYNEDDSFALLAATQVGAELEASRERERDAQLKLMQSLLGDAAPASAPAVTPNAVLPTVEGFGEEDDDVDDLVLRLRGGATSEDLVLRLRGGAGTDESDDSDSEDGDNESETDKEPMIVDETVAAREKTTLQMGSLKSMFQPQEAASGDAFSLLSGLDLELDPVERTPSPPPAPRYVAPAPPTAAFVPPATLGRANRAWIGTGPVTPFFPFPLGAFEGREGAVVDSELEKLGLSGEKAAQLAAESEKRLGEEAAGFWRQDDEEKIESKHQALRDLLRGHARKRHRESSKKGRNKGQRGNE